MNPFNAVVLFLAWFSVAIAAGGLFLARDPYIAFAVLLLNTVVLTAVIAGSDRHDRECHGADW